MNQKLIQSYLSRGLSIIPVNNDKTPTVRWGDFQKRFIREDEFKLFNSASYIGVVCGSISGNLICIDIDLKYDITNDLYNRIKRAVPIDLYNKLWIQKTVSGGYHWIYRVDTKVNGGNQKLANRPTTSDEKNAAYLYEISTGKPKDEAIKIAGNDKIRVLIETRQEGGYFIAYGNGYEYIEGKLSTITIDEHSTLIDIMRTFNEFFTTVKEDIKAVINSDGSDGVHPFDAYNTLGNVHELLINNGWSYVFEDDIRVHYKRPGNSASITSGHWHKELKLFKVFSTSTILEPGKAYTPASLFIEIECGGDKNLAIKKLHELGFGDVDDREKYIKKLCSSIHAMGDVLGINDGTVMEKANFIINKLRDNG